MLYAPNGDPLPRVITAELAAALGFGAGEVRTERRRGRWQDLVRGVYLTRPDPASRADWLRAGLAIAGTGAAVSGWDALVPRRIGAERPPVETVLILTSAGTHRTQSRICFRPSRRAMTVERMLLPGAGTLPVVGAARAVADTSLVYRRFDPVRALVTSAVQRKLCTPADLQRELEAGPQNGSAHLRRAIEDVLTGVESISEAELADIVRAGGLPWPEFNVPIVDSRGVVHAHADALWRTLRAGLEVDSKKYHFEEDKWLGTMKRHNRLTARRLSLTHYPPVQLLAEPRAVTAEIDQWLRGRALDLRVPYPPPPGPPLPLHTPFVIDDQQG